MSASSAATINRSIKPPKLEFCKSSAFCSRTQKLCPFSRGLLERIPVFWFTFGWLFLRTSIREAIRLAVSSPGAPGVRHLSTANNGTK